jgi:hypothetical protein
MNDDSQTVFHRQHSTTEPTHLRSLRTVRKGCGHTWYIPALAGAELACDFHVVLCFGRDTDTRVGILRGICFSLSRRATFAPRPWPLMPCSRPAQAGQAFSLRRASARFETDQPSQTKAFLRVPPGALNSDAREIRHVSKRPAESRPAGTIACPTRAPMCSKRARLALAKQVPWGTASAF